MAVAELQTTHHKMDRGSGRAFLYHRRRVENAAVLAAADAAAIVGAMFLAGAARFVFLGAALIPEWTWLLVVAWWCGAYFAGLLPSWGLDTVSELRRTVKLLMMLFGGTALLLFLFKQGAEMSRMTVTIGFVYSILFIPLCRVAVKRLLVKANRWGVPAVIYGMNGASARVIRALHEEQGYGYVPVAVFDDNPDLWGDYVEGVPVLGGMHHSAPGAPVAVLVGSGIPQEWVASLLEGPLSRYKQAVVVPDLFDVPSLWVKSRNMAGLLGFEITSNLLDPLPQLTKRGMDLLLVLTTFPVWGPLYVLVGAAIRLEDDGPALFYQERVGKDGQVFRVPKFRTMHANADDVLERILDTDDRLRSEWEASHKLSRDPRVTRVGAFLRRWSLDELPQFFSVLKGDMSLVGPRPLPHYHAASIDPRIQQLRTRVRPGMTGQWQVSGRSDIGDEGIERQDAFYVRNWSVWLDIVILFRSVRAVLRGAGAY